MIGRSATPWLACAIVALAITPYLVTLRYGLVWDDPALVGLVERAYRDGGLWRVAMVEFRLDPQRPTGYYRPVVLLSLWADRALGGASGAAYHATNVLLHATCTLLFAVFAGTVLRSIAGGLAAGVLFATHPVHVEAVAFIAGRTDLWAGVFVFAAALAWAQGREAVGVRHAALVAASGAALALGGLSKETALALPAVLVTLDTVFPRTRSAGRWWRRLAPWLAAWASGAMVVLAVRAASGIAFPTPKATPTTSALLTDPALAPQILSKMLAQYAVPWPLNAYWERDQLVWSLGTLAAATLGAAVFVAAARWSGWRVAAAGAIWSVIFMMPASGLVPHGSAPFAERFLYIPSAGFCLAAGSVVVAARAPGRVRRAAISVLGVVALVFVVASASRAAVWKDEVSLFESLVRSAPNNAALWDDLGQAYEVAGRIDDAVGAYREALRRNPKRAGAWNSLGVVWGRQGRLGDAVHALREAIRLDPKMPHSRFNLALLCVSLGDRACAEEQRLALEKLAPEAADRVEQAMRGGR
jgi:tetratricopeptide (TPR) repeat protein